MVCASRSTRPTSSRKRRTHSPRSRQRTPRASWPYGWTHRVSDSLSEPFDKSQYSGSMFDRVLIAAVVVLAVVSSATAVLPAAAKTNSAVGTHKLIVAVKKNLAPAAEKKLAILVLITQNGGAPAGALATSSKPLTVLQERTGLYR